MIKKVVVLLAIGASIFGLYHFVNQFFQIPDDNPVEQAVEALIKAQTGLDIDLTPEKSDESKN